LTEGSQDARVQAARDRVAEIKADYDETVRLFRDRKISPTAFAEVEPGKLDDLKRAEKELAELETPSELHSLGLDPGMNLLTWWRDLPPNGRRAVMRLLFARIVINRSPSRGHRVPLDQRVDAPWRATTPRRWPRPGVRKDEGGLTELRVRQGQSGQQWPGAIKRDRLPLLI